MDKLYKTLNFINREKNIDEKSGIYTIGNCYNTQTRGEASSGREIPALDQKSKKAIQVVESELRKTMLVKESLFPFMRVSFIKDASTRPHVDDIRGITPTFVFITKQSAINFNHAH